MIGNFLGFFEKPHSYAKTALATFWATFGKNRVTLLGRYLSSRQNIIIADRSCINLSCLKNYITINCRENVQLGWSLFLFKYFFFQVLTPTAKVKPTRQLTSSSLAPAMTTQFTLTRKKRCQTSNVTSPSMSDFDFPDDDLLCPIGSDDPLKNPYNVDADVAGN